MASYEHLLSPGCIGRLELRNRIFMSPMGSNTADPEGYCGERLRKYYAARAEGGAALLIMGSVAISWPVGSANFRQVAISDDRFIPGLAAVADEVHVHGAKLAVQLQHAGLTAMNDIRDGRPLLTPSIPVMKDGDMGPYLFPDEAQRMSTPYSAPTAKLHYRVASEEDLAWVVAEFATAAARAREAGIDAVEIHAGHGYLVHSFLNPAVNTREDRWGGSLENRARLLVEVIRAIKDRCGADYPVWCRLDGIEFLTEGGITHEDACATARLAEAAGADAIHVSAYADASKGESFTLAHTVHKPAGFVPFAAGIKSVVKIPVITAGRIEPAAANDFIRRGSFDFVTMARKLLADPELPRKLGEGRAAEIRPCIYCYTCISQIFVNEATKCAVNARTGRENETVIVQAERSRRIMIAGGGPAGMETARVARLRGHQVILCEKSSRLGGTVRFSATSYAPNAGLVRYLCGEMTRLGVEVRLGTELTADLVAREKPDEVVIAVGARREVPAIPGIELSHVLSGDDIRAMLTGELAEGPGPALGDVSRLLLGAGKRLGVLERPDWMRMLSRLWMPLGQRIVMIGGGLVAIELAEFLAERGRKVTVLEAGEVLGAGLKLVRRWRNIADCKRLGVEMLTGALPVRIDTDSVVYRNSHGQERRIAADQVIITSGAVANPGLAASLSSAGIEVHEIGDCAGIGYIDGAIHAGFDLAMNL
ncbi:MAG: FAD-dependent oxidoreductase [Gammaproteobacteria bacterium]|nr:FAD-dependent oxidoreductase [Gammaproteobacteria bacterium]